MEEYDEYDENDENKGIIAIIIKQKGEECIPGKKQCADGLTCEHDWYNREGDGKYACTDQGPTPNPFPKKVWTKYVPVIGATKDSDRIECPGSPQF